jgi:hypothetical protein
MKILFENKQLNEGPGAGYTVSGTLTNVKVNAIKDIQEIEKTDLVVYEVELDATATFGDVSANSYYYGGTVDSTPVSIIRARVEFEEGEVTNEDIKWALEGAKIEASLGGGWSHSTFDGFIEVDYNGIENASYLMGVLFELTDKDAVEYLDRAVQDGYTDTLYAVVVDGVQEDAFDTPEEAINYIKQYGGDEVVTIYQTMLSNGDIDVETGDTVWTNDDMEESLNEDKKEGKTLDANAQKSLKSIMRTANSLFNEKNIQYATTDELISIADKFLSLKDKVSKHNVSESAQKPLTESFDDEDRINALAEFLNIDPSEISNIYDYEYETPEGDYLVVTEEEAEELAKEDIRNIYDDLGLESFTPGFRDWIIMNALDNDWFEDAIRESYESYVENIESESSSMGYDNRLIEEMHDHQVLSDEDFEIDEDGEPNLRELKEGIDIDDKKEEFIDLLVENAGNAVDYCGDNFGWDWVTEMASTHNLVDLEEVVDQCIYEDGVAHFIARYDGEEIELENGLYAYRTN